MPTMVAIASGTRTGPLITHPPPPSLSRTTGRQQGPGGQVRGTPDLTQPAPGLKSPPERPGTHVHPARHRRETQAPIRPPLRASAQWPGAGCHHRGRQEPRPSGSWRLAAPKVSGIYPGRQPPPSDVSSTSAGRTPSPAWSRLQGLCSTTSAAAASAERRYGGCSAGLSQDLSFLQLPCVASFFLLLLCPSLLPVQPPSLCLPALFLSPWPAGVR